jgi:hypothetical protein
MMAPDLIFQAGLVLSTWPKEVMIENMGSSAFRTRDVLRCG